LSKRPRILFLAHLFPLPLDSGGKIKSYYTLKTLAADYDVCILAYVRTGEEQDLVPELRNICPDIDIVPLRRNRLTQASDLLTSLLRNRSFIISRDFRREMKLAFDRLVEDFCPDIVHIDHLQMAQFVDFGAPYKTVLDNHNVEAMIIRRVAETADSPGMRLYASVEWPKLQRYETDCCCKCDLVLTVSDEDNATLRHLTDHRAHIRTVPIGVDTDYHSPVKRAPNSRNILSIGTMYWPPNVDSMLYFSKEIFPLVKKQIPEAILTIAGQKPTASIRALAADASIKVTGYVDDSRTVAQDCGVFIVPLRSGSGVRVKILNALAMGLPVVSTSVGAEGLDVISGKHLILADDRDSFARAVIDVLTKPSLANTIGRNAREFVCGQYSWDTVGRRLLDCYSSTVVQQ